jgi:hypothetical protein
MAQKVKRIILKHDIKWIVCEELKKARLAKNFVQWLDFCYGNELSDSITENISATRILTTL